MYSLHRTLTPHGKLERCRESLFFPQPIRDVRMSTTWSISSQLCSMDTSISEPFLRKSGRILATMLNARGSKTAWLLRLAAFVLFISGGALAQRYLTAPSVIRALPLERQQKQQPSAVLLETTRKIEFAASFADAAQPIVTPFTVSLEDASVEPRVAVVCGVAWVGPAFDALAPPVSA